MKNTAIFVAICLTLAGIASAQHAEVVAEGLRNPTGIVCDPTHPSRFYIAEQKTCAVRIIEDGELLDEPLITLDTEGIVTTGWEQGLLGIELDPEFSENRHFYVNYTAKRLGKKRDPGTTHISRFTMSDPHSADTASEKVFLTVEQPYPNHNCGNLRFGPDGMLYVGLGDGGAANDPRGAGQNMKTLLGKIVRIDVHGEPSEGKAYAIPQDNPFIGQKDALPEIWALGVRNPWGMEFDSTGRLWWADVGQNRFEEINMQPADSAGGENYGWNTMEGMRRFEPRNPGKSSSEDPERMAPEQHLEKGFTPPVWEYRHWSAADQRFRNGSVTGGFFYEGTKVRALRKRYIFADFMFGKVWSFRIKDGRADDVSELTSNFKSAFPGENLSFVISAFGRDTAGELYILDHKGGRLLKIVN